MKPNKSLVVENSIARHTKKTHNTYTFWGESN